MSSIIRASDGNRAIQGVAFNFEDMTQQANQYLDKVRVQAARIVVQAQEEADAIRRRAREDGHKTAVANAEKQVEQRVARNMETLMPALREAVAKIHQAKQAWLTHWEKSAVHVAVAVAGRLIRRELSRTPEITLTLVKEALELAAGSPEIRLHLNPADHAALAGQVEHLIAEFSPLAPAQVVPDPEISLGGCRVETRFGVIDQQFEAQLARIEEELT